MKVFKETQYFVTKTEAAYFSSKMSAVLKFCNADILGCQVIFFNLEASKSLCVFVNLKSRTKLFNSWWAYRLAGVEAVVTHWDM